MSYDPRNRVRAVINVCNQTYENKSLFMLYQKVDGRFPEPMDFKALPFQVDEINVDHITGKNWWMLKMMAFCKAARERFPVADPLCAIMDEDDGFDTRYLENTVKSLNHYPGLKAVWTYTNMFVTKQGFHIKKHREPIGTTVAYLSSFEHVTAICKERYPTLTNGENDPLDAKWRGIMKVCYLPETHGGLRYFNIWSGSSTRRGKELEIDS